MLLDAAGAGGIGLLRPVRGRDRAGSTGRAGSAAADPTDEQGTRVDEVEWQDADPEVLARARRIAALLRVRPPTTGAVERRGSGRPRSARWSGVFDEIDLDATLERTAGTPAPEEDDIVVRESVRTRRPLVLAVDVSGSMRGERVRTAAATVGAVAAVVPPADLAVVAFWSDALLLTPLDHRMAPGALLEMLVRVPARGLTNVSFPLEVGRRELGRCAAAGARVLLLSDCVHNAGPDPRVAATALPRLDVLLDASGEHDEDLGRDLARCGRGGMARVRDHRDVAPGLTRLLA